MTDDVLQARLDRCRQLMLPPERDAGEFPAQLRQRLAESEGRRGQPGSTVRRLIHALLSANRLRR